MLIIVPGQLLSAVGPQIKICLCVVHPKILVKKGVLGDTDSKRGRTDQQCYWGIEGVHLSVAFE